MQDSKTAYKEREEAYQNKLDQLKGKINLVSNTRLIVMLIGLGSSVYLYFRGDEAGNILLFITLAVFITLVIVHNYLKAEAKKCGILLDINKDSMKRINGEWNSFEDSGADFEDHDHPYTSDLDIFGSNSLYQWMNTAITYSGRHTLKGWLDKPSKDSRVICNRQSASKELAGLVDWRQHFQADAIIEQKEIHDPQPLFDWAKSSVNFYLKPAIAHTVKFLPYITLALFVGAFILEFTYLIPAALILVQIVLLAARFIDLNNSLTKIQPFAKSVKAYRCMLQHFESQEFQSDYLIQLQEKLKDENGRHAYIQISQLERITDKLGIRYSQLYLLINILFLWDYRCLIAFEKWKIKSGRYLQNWITILGELEALASVAVIYFDHPDWACPKLHDDQLKLFASQAGHPLLPEDRVCNDVGVMREGQVYLVTGSNMSGKSTLLRTVGINLVLAYAGAPVCAREFHCSIFSIYTSMRIRDDLRSNISSFYAELLRIKKMVDAAKRGESVFFLLDEIFRGTNSRDRHTGARVLIKQLSNEGAVGLASTHDVELGDLAKENNKIKNYHFRETYVEGQLQFDYKLREGVSNTRNAVYLMKMAGITVTDESEKGRHQI